MKDARGGRGRWGSRLKSLIQIVEPNCGPNRGHKSWTQIMGANPGRKSGTPKTVPLDEQGQVDIRKTRRQKHYEDLAERIRMHNIYAKRKMK